MPPVSSPLAPLDLLFFGARLLVALRCVAHLIGIAAGAFVGLRHM